MNPMPIAVIETAEALAAGLVTPNWRANRAESERADSFFTRRLLSESSIASTCRDATSAEILISLASIPFPAKKECIREDAN